MCVCGLARRNNKKPLAARCLFIHLYKVNPSSHKYSCAGRVLHSKHVSTGHTAAIETQQKAETPDAQHSKVIHDWCRVVSSVKCSEKCIEMWVTCDGACSRVRAPNPTANQKAAQKLPVPIK